MSFRRSHQRLCENSGHKLAGASGRVTKTRVGNEPRKGSRMFFLGAIPCLILCISRTSKSFRAIYGFLGVLGFKLLAGAIGRE